MPLSLFHHGRFAHYRSVENAKGPYRHTFGGSADSFGMRFVNVDPPLHLLYRLDLQDPSVPVELAGFDFLPLVYGFRYAGSCGTLIYRFRTPTEIEVVAPTELEYEADFPYSGHPDAFPLRAMKFEQIPYNRAVAEDAMALQGVFGLEGLSPSEMANAVSIGLANNSYVCFSREDHPDWTDEEIVSNLGRAPFIQGSPSKSCDNPDCTAEIAYRREAFEIQLPEFADVVGEEPIRIEAQDVRVDSMRVIAIHQPEPDDTVIWGDPFIQIIFEYCDCCHCIRVSNQCT